MWIRGFYMALRGKKMNWTRFRCKGMGWIAREDLQTGDAERMNGDTEEEWPWILL